MNEFVAKKLGEVLAFSRIGLECKQRAGGAFDQALGAESDFADNLGRFAETVEARANEVTTTKAEKTTEKLRGMMEAYIGDEWDNPTEILEWLSFFSGAGSAHWALVTGAAATIEDSELGAIAAEARDTYMGYLHQVNERLEQNGKERAAA